MGKKAEKSEIDACVKELLALKAKYKEATGKDWKPGTHQTSKAKEGSPTKQAKEASPPKEASNAGDQLNVEITDAGNKVHDLKSKKAEKSEIDACVKELLALKAKYKEATGKDWKPGTHQPSKAKEGSPTNKVTGWKVIFAPLPSKAELASEIGVEVLENVLKGHQYLAGEKATQVDIKAFEGIAGSPSFW